MDDAADDRDTLPLQRSEALSDGIYAVAMTLLVIELKVPDAAQLGSARAVLDALAALQPKATAWLISFFVLAMFWVAHHRVFSRLRRADGTLVWLNLVQLAFVSLMPFSSALVGENGVLPAQIVYSANMALLAASGLSLVRYAHRHPSLARTPMPLAVYKGARLRVLAVIVISAAAVVIAAFVPWLGGGNIAFILMAVINPMSHRAERRWLRQDAQAEPSLASPAA